MEDRLFRFYVLLSMCLTMVLAGPQFCTRGFQLASRFHKCWEQATFVNKYPPLHEPHEYLDGKFFEAYANHMCSVVKPKALDCLSAEVKECSNAKKLMDIADKSGGACSGNRLNPFFKKYVIDHLVAVKGDSPCFELADNSYECYTSAGQKVMQTMGSKSDNIVTFHKVADKFFDAYWDCMVEIYKSNIKVCPHWQIPMLLTLQKTAMPSLFGLRLQPEQIKKLELNTGNSNKTEVQIPQGPSSLFLLLQLHKTKPEVSSMDEDSLVIELSDLNEQSPHLEVEGLKEEEEKEALKNLTLKEIKKLMREQRRRNKELKDFISQARGEASKKKSTKSKGGKVVKKSQKQNDGRNGGSGRKKLNLDDMVA